MLILPPHAVILKNPTFVSHETVRKSVDEHRRLFMRATAIAGISLLVKPQELKAWNLVTLIGATVVMVITISELIDAIENIYNHASTVIAYITDDNTSTETEIVLDADNCTQCEACIDEIGGSGGAEDLYSLVSTCPSEAFVERNGSALTEDMFDD